MAISFGPKLGLLFNANIDEVYYDSFRPFLQALDQLVNGSVINSTTVVPPSSPNPGDAYLILSAASGAWTSFPVNSIAVWDTQVTNSGTNTTNPSWVNYVPKAGWLVWNVAQSALLVYSTATSSWQVATGAVSSVFARTGAVTAQTGDYTVAQVTGAAHNAANSDITSMTGLTATTGTAVTVAGLTTGTGVSIAGPAGSSGEAIIVNDGVHAQSSWSLAGLVTCAGVVSSGNISGGAILSSGGFVSDSLSNATPAGPISVTNSGSGAIAIRIVGTGTIYQSMLGFVTYPTQTTVGAAGGASALPANPTGYLPVSIAGTTYVIPYYLHV